MIYLDVMLASMVQLRSIPHHLTDGMYTYITSHTLYNLADHPVTYFTRYSIIIQSKNKTCTE